MILEVMIWGCSFATVQSAVTSAESCLYGTHNGSCSGSPISEVCIDLCAVEQFNCDQLSCDLLLIGMEEQELGFVNWGTCYTPFYLGAGPLDTISTCEDDGRSPCDGGDQDLCMTTCFSANGNCENCYDIPVDMSEQNPQHDLGGLDCDTYAGLFPSFFPGEEFPGYCSCFTLNESDVMFGCPSACGSGSSDNTGSGSSENTGSGSSNNTGSGSSDNTVMIIGIVVGVVVLIVIVVAVSIFCMKRRKL